MNPLDNRNGKGYRIQKPLAKENARESKVFCNLAQLGSSQLGPAVDQLRYTLNLKIILYMTSLKTLGCFFLFKVNILDENFDLEQRSNN